MARNRNNETSVISNIVKRWRAKEPNAIRRELSLQFNPTYRIQKMFGENSLAGFLSEKYMGKAPQKPRSHSIDESLDELISSALDTKVSNRGHLQKAQREVESYKKQLQKYEEYIIKKSQEYQKNRLRLSKLMSLSVEQKNDQIKQEILRLSKKINPSDNIDDPSAPIPEDFMKYLMEGSNETIMQKPTLKNINYTDKIKESVYSDFSKKVSEKIIKGLPDYFPDVDFDSELLKKIKYEIEQEFEKNKGKSPPSLFKKIIKKTIKEHIEPSVFEKNRKPFAEKEIMEDINDPISTIDIPKETKPTFKPLSQDDVEKVLNERLFKKIKNEDSGEKTEQKDISEISIKRNTSRSDKINKLLENLDKLLEFYRTNQIEKSEFSKDEDNNLENSPSLKQQLKTKNSPNITEDRELERFNSMFVYDPIKTKNYENTNFEKPLIDFNNQFKITNEILNKILNLLEPSILETKAEKEISSLASIIDTSKKNSQDIKTKTDFDKTVTVDLPTHGKSENISFSKPLIGITRHIKFTNKILIKILNLLENSLKKSTITSTFDEENKTEAELATKKLSKIEKSKKENFSDNTENSGDGFMDWGSKIFGALGITGILTSLRKTIFGTIKKLTGSISKYIGKGIGSMMKLIPKMLGIGIESPGILSFLPKMFTSGGVLSSIGAGLGASSKKVLSLGLKLGGGVVAGLAGLLAYPVIEGVAEWIKSGSFNSGLSKVLSSLTFDLIDKDSIQKYFIDPIGLIFEKSFESIGKTLSLLDPFNYMPFSNPLKKETPSENSETSKPSFSPDIERSSAPERSQTTSPISKVNSDTTMTSEFNPKIAQLFDVIHRAESSYEDGNKGYDNAYGGLKYLKLTGGKKITDMTLDEIINLQPEMTRTLGSSAVGRYQFMRDTLKGLKKELKLTGEEKFDAKLQDKLAFQLLERRGLNEYLSGNMSADKFQDNLSFEWAGLPNSRGENPYKGVGLNRGPTIDSSPLRKSIKELGELSPESATRRPDIISASNLNNTLRSSLESSRDSLRDVSAETRARPAPVANPPVRMTNNRQNIPTSPNSPNNEAPGKGTDAIVQHLLVAMGVTSPH